MAKLAVDSGANIIKHQTHIIEDEMSKVQIVLKYLC